MGEKTGIAWTDSTWNPVRGCTKVSAGCKHCYAETFAERWRGVPGHAFEQGFDLRLVPEALELPLRWRKHRRVFVNSMSDLFHEGVPFDYVDKVFDVMERSGTFTSKAHPEFNWTGHTFQVLTKRPARMRAYVAQRIAKKKRYADSFKTCPTRAMQNSPAAKLAREDAEGIRSCIWLGVSVEDQRAADERIPELLATPAAVRFLSCEPLLGPVELRASKMLDGIDWLIVGGESGPGARSCWVPDLRSLVAQCRRRSVPVFVKQLGANVQDRNDAGWEGIDPWEWPETVVQEDRIEHLEEGYQGAPVRVHLNDRAGRDPAEWPADLRVQQFPEVTRG